jgi:predicted nucleotidyltransferase
VTRQTAVHQLDFVAAPDRPSRGFYPGLSRWAMMVAEVAMISVIESKQELLADLCRCYGVRRLELFGSAATGAFDPTRSDLDFLVEFLPEQELGPWLRHYFAFRTELAQLFGRSVDLVLAGAVKSPHFRRELDRTRTLLYAA